MSITPFLALGVCRRPAIVCAAIILCSSVHALAQSNVAERAPWQAAPGQRVASRSPTSYSNAGIRVAQNVPAADPARPIPQPANNGVLAEPGGGDLGAGMAYGDDTCSNGDCAAPCDDACCDFGCAPSERLWVRGEYLMWWTKAANVVPLVTTGPLTSTQSTAGVLGQPGTEILFGGDSLDLGVRSGARFNVGWWFDECQGTAIEATYMFLGSKSLTYDNSSPGDPIIAIPFFNARSALEDSIIVAFPGEKSGSVHVDFSNELASAEVLIRQCLLEDCGEHLDFLIGYRFTRFDEDFNISHNKTYLSAVGAIPQGTVQDISDSFDANNEFHGIELGFATRSRYNRVTFELLGKLALGGMRSRMSIHGSTVTTVPGGAPVPADDGMFALSTNSGDHERTNFAVVPELGATVGYDLTCRLRATMGYTFLYLSQVARPTDHVERDINPTFFPGDTPRGYPAPTFTFCPTDFWAQGLNFGLDYRF